MKKNKVLIGCILLAFAVCIQPHFKQDRAKNASASSHNAADTPGTSSTLLELTPT
jgi:hypothetical protein